MVSKQGTVTGIFAEARFAISTRFKIAIADVKSHFREEFLDGVGSGEKR